MDVRFEDHGSQWLARPLTAAAQAWIREHVSIDAQYSGGALVIEPRHVPDIYRGMTEAGLAVQTP